MAAPRPRPLSVAQQALCLKREFPEATLAVKAGQLLCRHTLKPTPLSRGYRVQLTYRVGGIPKVRVLDELQRRQGETLPHVYGDETLCLHERDDWSGHMWIATTTVPWISEWLMYYELWLPDGEWYGGGAWPPSRPAGKVAA
jgi:hypothetical protein